MSISDNRKWLEIKCYGLKKEIIEGFNPSISEKKLETEMNKECDFLDTLSLGGLKEYENTLKEEVVENKHEFAHRRAKNYADNKPKSRVTLEELKDLNTFVKEVWKFNRLHFTRDFWSLSTPLNGEAEVFEQYLNSNGFNPESWDIVSISNDPGSSKFLNLYIEEMNELRNTTMYPFE